MDNPLVSVIIVTYNRADIVVRCIDSLLKSTYDNMEIIVIDNNSIDNSVKLINDFCKKTNSFSKVNVVSLKENLMNAGGRNVGIERSRGEYLLFVDSDNILDKNAVELMLSDLLNNKDIASVTALTIQNDDRREQRLYASISLYTSKLKQKTCNYKREKLENFVSTGCSENVFMIRREVIDRIGYFDKSYYMMYEEADFDERMKRAGYRLVTEPKARTLHFRVKTDEEQTELRALGIGFPLRAFYFARNRTVFMRKYSNIGGKLLYFLVFMHLFMGYYCMKAIKWRRFDIAREYFRGYIKGIFVPISKSNYVQLEH